ncbi:hypothetical protein Nepgr_024027 [Nepenthes gracilis]|uniref:Uncharacterized protein n=1 Tax=Nepenthes gracilis TaxID=150966 RepID=A0AAD3XZN6_NEPGR|nr:hypothetical protein Nepgr_024027 [Nepenthes gracilis]
MGPLPSKISIKDDENVLAKAVVIVVDYQWKPKHHGNGRPANQKNTSKSTAANQAIVNLNPDVVSVGCGYPSSQDDHQAGDNSQWLNLYHTVTSAEPEASNAIFFLLSN